MKHTPGPWGIFNIDRFAIGECENESDHTLGRIIAVTCHHPTDPFFGIPDKEAKANANLIAAAPDLLETAKKAKDLIGNRDFAEAYKVLYWAIAKAEDK